MEKIKKKPTGGAGHHFGRPAEYESAEDLWNAAWAYFETTKNSSGRYKPAMDMLTFTVGFASRSSWVDYAKRSPEFSFVVSKIRMFVRGCYEQNLTGFAWAGSQFALRNLGQKDWKDEIHEQVNSTNKNIIVHFGGNNLQPAQESETDS